MRLWQTALKMLAVAALIFSTYIAFLYRQQPLVEMHGFRQTQTALTAYWMLKEGWKFAYETPVAGFPWSLPFEFPIYQAIVALVSSLSGLELGVAGRLVSWAFLLACGWPAFAIRRRLDLPPAVPWVFCALLWTSPQYVFWGRTFMIETAAMFFSFACIPYAIDVIRGRGGWVSLVLFALLATAATLQKSTTGGPVIVFLFLVLGVHVLPQIRESGLGAVATRPLFAKLFILGLPLLVGLAWARYADDVKMLNPFGTQLTVAALKGWNFGNLPQRLSLDTYELVLWKRSIVPNAGGSIGMALLVAPWFMLTRLRVAIVSLCAVVLFLLPILIFTNLQIVHDYYQTGCILFLIAALSVAVGGTLTAGVNVGPIVVIVTLALMASNLRAFADNYSHAASRKISESNYRPLAVAQVLREQTEPGTAIVAFGAEWNSELAYYSQRKSMIAPVWFKKYRDLWENPKRYVGGLELGAIVVCPSKGFPGPAEVHARRAEEPGWRLVHVEACDILIATHKP